jgi:lysozyme
MLTWLKTLTETTSKTLKGVDVSSFQGPPADWAASAGAISWAAVKITELEPDGTRYVNPDAAADWDWLKNKKKGRVAYLFGHPSVSATDTVDFFLEKLKPLGIQDSDAVALDLEVSNGLGASAVAAWGRSVMSQLEKKLDRKPLLYTFIDFATEGNCAGLEGYPLWIAAPSDPAGKPQVPKPWKTWTMHQYDISGDIDRDVANYTSLAHMSAALGKSKPKPAPPPEELPLEKLGGIASGISSARWPNGVVVVAAVATSGYIDVIRWNGKTWSEWNRVSPTTALNSPSLVIVDNEHAQMYYIETTGEVVELKTADNGETWE